jgi:hypothetical protein
MRTRLLLALPVCALLLAGCAQGPTRGYEGPVQPAAVLALLDIPATIDVTAIDGHDTSAGLLGPRDRQVQVLAGEHVLTLRYIGVFKSAISGDDDIIRSAPVALRFVAVAGHEYRFRLATPADADAARRFAGSPRFDLVESGSGQVFSSVLVKSYAEASLLDTISKAMQGDQAEAPHATNLDLLKDIWGRSSAAEKAAFKAWLDTGAGKP